MKKLFEAALDARKKSYSPYSKFKVGAALLGESGCIYTGCNVENASYGAASCAERNAFFAAVSAGERRFRSIAIAGGHETLPEDYCMPCGICRQVMAEFCPPDFPVYLVKNTEEVKGYTLDELLPHSFQLD